WVKLKSNSTSKLRFRFLHRRTIDTMRQRRLLCAPKNVDAKAPCLLESVELSKRIRYSDHLQLRMSLRRIPRPLPRSIYRRAKEVFYDHRTGHLVAIARSRYGGRLREMMVAYSEIEDEVTLITVHPLKPRQKTNRLASGRWIPHEREKK